MILIISNDEDVHAKCVAHELNKLGEAACILDLKLFGNTSTITCPIGDGCPRIVLPQNLIIERNKVKSVWLRRPAEIDIPSVTDPDDRTFAQREWADTFSGFLSSLDAKFVNPIMAQRMAVKPYQLEIAHHIGFRIPRTCITNDPKEAEKFAQSFGGRIIHKSISAPHHRFLDTRRWSETDLSTLADLPIAPTILQEEIFGSSEFRVTVVGNDVFTARISTSKGTGEVDSRLDLELPYEQFQLPESVRELLLKLMQELGLVFGTIDMKITEKGEYVFFEVNPQGQFLYVEILTGMPITKTLAELLAAE